MTLPPPRATAPYPDGMDGANETPSDLLSNLEVIEAQPLATRATAYESLHDTLARRLDTDPSAGTTS